MCLFKTTKGNEPLSSYIIGLNLRLENSKSACLALATKTSNVNLDLWLQIRSEKWSLGCFHTMNKDTLFVVPSHHRDLMLIVAPQRPYAHCHATETLCFSSNHKEVMLIGTHVHCLQALHNNAFCTVLISLHNWPQSVTANLIAKHNSQPHSRASPLSTTSSLLHGLDFAASRCMDANLGAPHLWQRTHFATSFVESLNFHPILGLFLGEKQFYQNPFSFIPPSSQCE